MKKYIWLPIIILLVIIIILIINPFKYFKQTTNIHTDIENYNKYLNKLINNYDVHSALYIFPKEIDNNKVIDFKYIKEDGLFDGSYLLYLVIKYDKDEYNKELSRIKNISIDYKNEVKKILFTNNGFNYPAYITIYDNNGSYEYVLFDEKENNIIYIFNQLFDLSNIDKNYLPNNYKLPKENIDNKRNGYNMYYYYDLNGDGISYDEIGDIKMNIKVIINDKEYNLQLEDNETSKYFVNNLLKEYKLNDLNNNEKYVYMSDKIPINPIKVNKIKKGDVMIYEDNCLVIFYKSFNTNYSYTKIGHIDDLDDLDNNSIFVKFIK